MRFILILSMLTTVAFLAAADQPEPATILRADNGATLDVQLLSESLDEVKYLLGSGPTAAESSLPRAKVKRVEYGAVNDLDYNKATGSLNRKDYDKAAAQFLQAAASSPYARVREMAYIEAAKAFIEAKKQDQAIKALNDLEAKAPRSVRLPKAYAHKARMLRDQGDLAGAQAAAQKLSTFDPIEGAVIKAELLRSDKKFAESAKELQGIWGSALTDATETAEGQPTYADVGFLLAGDLKANKDEAGAMVIYDTIAYSRVGKDNQGQAHLAIAQALQGGDKTAQIKAFDHALMAAGLSRSAKQSARKLLLNLIAEFDKDPAMKNDVTEYRTYVNAL